MKIEDSIRSPDKKQQEAKLRAQMAEAENAVKEMRESIAAEAKEKGFDHPEVKHLMTILNDIDMPNLMSLSKQIEELTGEKPKSSIILP